MISLLISYTLFPKETIFHFENGKTSTRTDVSHTHMCPAIPNIRSSPAYSPSSPVRPAFAEHTLSLSTLLHFTASERAWKRRCRCCCYFRRRFSFITSLLHCVSIGLQSFEPWFVRLHSLSCDALRYSFCLLIRCFRLRCICTAYSPYVLHSFFYWIRVDFVHHY